MKLMEAFDRINEEYETDPEHWKHVFGTAEDGYFTHYIFHREEVWVLKQSSKFGLIGFGDKVKIEEDEIAQKIFDDPFSTGHRPLPLHILEKMMRNRKLPAEVKDINPISIKEIMEIEPPAYLNGPSHHQSPLSSVSESQRGLEKKLKRELKRLEDRDFSYV